MDYFTRLEKRVASLVPGTEDYDKFLEGQAFSLGCTPAQVEAALRINFSTIGSKEELVDFYIEELVFDHDTFDFTADEAIDIAHIILFNVLFCLHTVQDRFSSEQELKKYLTQLHNTYYKEYAELFEVAADIEQTTKPTTNNVIQFKRGK